MCNVAPTVYCSSKFVQTLGAAKPVSMVHTHSYNKCSLIDSSNSSNSDRKSNTPVWTVIIFIKIISDENFREHYTYITVTISLAVA